MITDLLLIALGGAVGSVLRFGVGFGMMAWLGAGFPWGTLSVNVLGCFVMGLLYKLLPELAGEAHSQWRFLLMTGVLGGFTTFSAFALDSAVLWMRNDILALLGYLGATIVLTLAGVAAGLSVGKYFVG